MATSLSYTTSQDQNFEIYSLIWLDTAVNSQENIPIQQQLRTSINHLVIFEDEQRCFNYIRSDLYQFIFIVRIQKENEQWAKQFTKVKKNLLVFIIKLMPLKLLTQPR